MADSTPKIIYGVSGKYDNRITTDLQPTESLQNSVIAPN